MRQDLLRQDLRLRFVTLAVAALGVCAAAPVLAQQPAPTPPPPARGCPFAGWQEGLGRNFQQPNSLFPTQDTASLQAPDCNFHQWSVEAFVWATTLNKQNVPRFMTLPTEEDLLTPLAALAGTVHPRTLQLAARSIVGEGLPGYSEGAGAFVQADGNVLVAPNGYPVYTSVHMNPAYFATARKNLIFGGAYQKGDPNETFPVGAAVFKATWRRLAPDEKPPTDAYFTQAQVPVLTVQRSPTSITILPVPGKFVSATVVLVGLHVVGVTVNHPEFLWGTFEHNLNTPQVPDNSFSSSGSSPNNYTFYKANTSYADVNNRQLPPQLTFDAATQRFSPVTNAVLENQTGGENQQDGPGNVLAISGQGQRFFANEQKDKDKKIQADAGDIRQLLSGRHRMDAAEQLHHQQLAQRRRRLGQSRQHHGRDLRAVSDQHRYDEGEELLHVPQCVVLFVPKDPAAPRQASGRDQSRLVGRFGLRGAEHGVRQRADTVHRAVTAHPPGHRADRGPAVATTAERPCPQHASLGGATNLL